MSRKLEKFIGDNRNEFDDKMPSDKVWEKIAAGFTEEKKKKKVFNLTPIYKWSAAAAILITAGITVFLVLNNNKPKKDVPSEIVKVDALNDTPKNINSVPPEINDATKDIATVAPEYAEVNQFTKLIVLKQEELKALAPEQPELYRKFATDITQLDSSYKSLKKQFSATPNREVLIEAMIQNLQLQLNVLNQQLNIINQIKQSKKDSHEKGNQTI